MIEQKGFHYKEKVRKIDEVIDQVVLVYKDEKTLDNSIYSLFYSINQEPLVKQFLLKRFNKDEIKQFLLHLRSYVIFKKQITDAISGNKFREAPAYKSEDLEYIQSVAKRYGQDSKMGKVWEKLLEGEIERKKWKTISIKLKEIELFDDYANKKAITWFDKIKN